MRYEPGAVPQEYQSSFLQTELQRIADSLNLEPAYGGLRQYGGQALSVTATPQKMPFTAALPSQNVTPDVPNDEFVVAEGGDYLLALALNAAASNRIVMNLVVHINGAPTPSDYFFEIITQADGANASPSTIASLEPGDVISLWVDGSPSRTVTFDNVNFYVQRVS